jgi:hypothetical protein
MYIVHFLLTSDQELALTLIVINYIGIVIINYTRTHGKPHKKGFHSFLSFLIPKQLNSVKMSYTIT